MMAPVPVTLEAQAFPLLRRALRGLPKLGAWRAGAALWANRPS
jgi:hypothetical protein